jgi:hypothetical protein
MAASCGLSGKRRAREAVRGELPWLQSGPLYRVHQNSWPVRDAFLNRWNYRRLQLDGRQMTTEQQAHFELHAAFMFPEWCGMNWDAFNDCFGDFVEETTEPSSRSSGGTSKLVRRLRPQPPQRWAGRFSSARSGSRLRLLREPSGQSA